MLLDKIKMFSRLFKVKKLLDCNVIVSPRPHSIHNIKQYFPTIVRINGFTFDKAEYFASKSLPVKVRLQRFLSLNLQISRKMIRYISVQFYFHTCVFWSEKMILIYRVRL